VIRWRTIAAVSARRFVADRSGLVVPLGFYAIVVVVIAGIWRAAAAANGGEVAGYTGDELTWYLATTEAAMLAVSMRLIAEVGTDIASGTVAVELLRPASVLGVRLTAELGRTWSRLAVLAPLGLVIATLAAGPPPRPATLLLVAPSLLLASLCNLALQHAAAAASFWVRDAGSAWFLYTKLVFIFGGMLIPLEALPAGIERAAALLPFRAMAYAPARLASGHLEPWLLVQQAMWVVACVAVARVAFSAGERRLQVVGG
jgi:ABC-2 type transport system permease protein